MEENLMIKIASNRPKTMKRWSKEDLEIIIDYLAASNNFEKPTSKAFYHEMVRDIEGRIKTTWTILYWKVRNLKKSFMKAEEWRISEDAKTLHEKHGFDVFNEHLLKLCPYYYRLKTIFIDNDPFALRIDHSDISECTKSQDTILQDDELDSIKSTHEFMPENCDTQIKIQFSPEQLPNSPFVTNFAEDYEHNQNEHPESPMLNCIENSKNHRNKAQNIKYNLEKMKIEREMELNKEKLKFEFEIRKQELELRRMEIEQDERLKYMEIQKNERLAKYELELKYKCNGGL